MKRNRILGMICGAGIVFCSILPIIAGSALQVGQEQVASNRDLIGTMRLKLPDLLVKEISLSKKCELEVTIANIGTAGVPASAYLGIKSVAVQLFKGHIPGPVIGLNAFDPLGKLKSPGGTATYVWPGVAVANGPDVNLPKFKVVVDPKNVLEEANETNNELTKGLICPLKPSITITHIHPTLEEVICWYHQNPPNKFKCIIFWTTKNYFYPKIKKIALICKMYSSNGTNYLPCNSVYTLATDVPNSGEYHFDLPYTSEHIGDFELKIYGYGNCESPAYPVCLH